MKSLIYADNAATTQMDTMAFEAMKPYLLQEYGNASQSYSFARQPKKAIKEAREIIASCIGALPEEIYFTSGGTESDNWAIKGTTCRNSDHCLTITTAFEHHAVLYTCNAIERLGYPVEYMYPDQNGTITPAILNRYITDETFLVSVMYANNEIGSIQPIKELSAIAHARGALFHTDAVQAVGHAKIDVNDLDVDLLSASSHKFNGAKGVGFLFIRNGTPITSYADGGAQERGLRAGTENVAGIVSMAAALKHNVDNLEKNRQHVLDLEKRLIEGLTAGKVIFVRNGGENTLPGIISLSFPNADGEAIMHRLDLMGIAVSTGSACNSSSTEVSHVLKAINLDDCLAKGTIRISLGKDNTEDHVDAIVAGLIRIMK